MFAGNIQISIHNTKRETFPSFAPLRRGKKTTTFPHLRDISLAHRQTLQRRPFLLPRPIAKRKKLYFQLEPTNLSSHFPTYVRRYHRSTANNIKKFTVSLPPTNRVGSLLNRHRSIDRCRPTSGILIDSGTDISIERKVEIRSDRSAGGRSLPLIGSQTRRTSSLLFA